MLLFVMRTSIVNSICVGVSLAVQGRIFAEWRLFEEQQRTRLYFSNSILLAAEKSPALIV